MALTRPEAMPERRRFRDTIPDTTVGSTLPPHSEHALDTLLQYSSDTGWGYTFTY